MKKYRIWFSILSPNAGYMDIDGHSEDDAKQILTDMMSKHQGLEIAAIRQIEATEPTKKDALDELLDNLPTGKAN